MDFHDVLRKRRSVRSYKNDPVPKKALDKIAEALALAPSACNLQPWSFRIVLNPEIREKICSCYGGKWLAEAPAIIVALANMEECWKRPEGTPIADIDIGIAMEHVVLAATAEGLATCWICAYEIEKMNRAIGVMAPWTTLAISPLGYANETPKPRPSKDRDEIFKIVP
jgi:nitroreductase